MFAGNYLKAPGLAGSLIPVLPHVRTTMIVVIPCFREPDILLTLESLQRCRRTKNKTEVIILINESENAPEEVHAFNHKTLLEILEWKDHLPADDDLVFHPVGPVALAARWAGAGLARKCGMDEAVYRFHRLNRPEGIIVSLDADTLVDENYLVEIETHFQRYPGQAGATIRFSHQRDGLSERQLRGILQYEKYLRYYKESLEWTGHPYALYTVGSAFAVTAGAYVKRGGMSRRKAGEDFYFLQNLTLVGTVGTIESTCVYPSARVSDRVPFGTGAAMKKWMEDTDEATLAFNFRAFKDLKVLFQLRHLFYRMTREEGEGVKQQLPRPITAFLASGDTLSRLEELSRNCSRQEVFNSRFYQIFNAFAVLKYMNYSHPLHYPLIPVEDSYEELLRQRRESG